MTEPYIVWALLVGIGIGGALVWFVLGRLPRRSEDVGPEERMAEAGWISDVLASRGGRTPELLVEQVLELHQDYLAGAPLELSAEDRAALREERERREAEHERHEAERARPQAEPASDQAVLPGEPDRGAPSETPR